MWHIFAAVILAACPDCPCGPDCDCGPTCHCLRPIAAVVGDDLPTLEAAQKTAARSGQVVVCWVGRRSPAGRSALPGCLHCYALAIDVRDGPGVLVGRGIGTPAEEWTWWGGQLAPLDGLREAAGIAPPPPPLGIMPMMMPMPMMAPMPMMGGCCGGGCSGGGCCR